MTDQNYFSYQIDHANKIVYINESGEGIAVDYRDFDDLCKCLADASTEVNRLKAKDHNNEDKNEEKI